jgi:hypothetical protein
VLRKAPYRTPEPYAAYEGWDYLVNSYKRLASDCQKSGTPLIVLLEYNKGETPVSMLSPGENEHDVAGLFRDLNVVVADSYPVVLKVMLERRQSSLRFLQLDPPIDCHPTAEGHWLMAQSYFPAVFKALARGRLDEATIQRVLAENDPTSGSNATLINAETIYNGERL